jgi:tRNA-binding protein
MYKVKQHLFPIFRETNQDTMETINWPDFEKVEIRVGTILEANDFPKARNPSYQLVIDFGPELGIKKSSAQITSLYQKEELVGKQVVAVVNFPPKQIANFMSECLVLGAVGDNKDIVLLQPDKNVINGQRIA